MKTIELNTNINCSSCVAAVTPTLNKIIGENNWKVDTANPKKVLTVKTDNLNEEELISAVEAAGYRAEKLF